MHSPASKEKQAGEKIENICLREHLFYTTMQPRTSVRIERKGAHAATPAQSRSNPHYDARPHSLDRIDGHHRRIHREFAACQPKFCGFLERKRGKRVR